MNLSIEHIIELDDISDADRAAIRSAIREDASLRRAVDNWIQVSEHVRANLDRSLPSREALVLFALEEQFVPADFTESERTLKLESESRLREALVHHPSVERIIQRIQDDADAFDRSWEAEMGVGSKKSGTMSADRAAVPLRKRTLRLVRTALSLVAVIAFIGIGISRFSANDNLVPTIVQTVDGEMRLVTLEDGSKVRLGPASSLSWNGDFSRSMSLNGSAFFDVVASPVPFEINTLAGKTTVLGTSFGIQSSGSSLDSAQQETIVTLVSGRVAVALVDSDPSENVILTPGKQAVLSRSGIQVLDVNLTEALAWAELIVFRDTPMKTVIEELSKRFDVKIEIDEDLHATPLTGTFDKERGVEEILDIVAAALGAKVTYDSETGIFSLSR